MDIDQTDGAVDTSSVKRVRSNTLPTTVTGFVLAGISLYLLSSAASVVTPILFAVFIAAVLSPVYRWLMAKGLNKGVILFILIGTILGTGVAISWLAVVSVQGLRASLVTYNAQLATQVEALLANITSDPEMAQTINQVLVSVLVSVVGITINVASNFLFAAMLTVFILVDFERLMGLATKQLKDQPVFGVLPAMVVTAVSYIGIRTRLNFVTGVGVPLLCLLFGIDYPFLWGVWAFMLSYVPYIGLIIATIPPALLGWAESGLLYALVIVVGISIINVTVENFLSPAYTAKKLELSPAIVFASFFFWAWLLGPVGALLSMPITVLFMLVFSRYEGTQGLALIMGQPDLDA